MLAISENCLFLFLKVSNTFNLSKKEPPRKYDNKKEPNSLKSVKKRNKRTFLGKISLKIQAICQQQQRMDQNNKNTFDKKKTSITKTTTIKVGVPDKGIVVRDYLAPTLVAFIRSSSVQLNPASPIDTVIPDALALFANDTGRVPRRALEYIAREAMLFENTANEENLTICSNDVESVKATICSRDVEQQQQQQQQQQQITTGLIPKQQDAKTCCGWTETTESGIVSSAMRHRVSISTFISKCLENM